MFEWGEAGVRALAPRYDVLVIVDVLSFSTAVSVAVDRGAGVFPSVELARGVQAYTAVPRQQTSETQPYSLSPKSAQSLQPGDKLILASPNGGTLSALAHSLGKDVIAGSLRNAQTIGEAVRGERVAVIAAGERWPDRSLRPAIEDLIGAGAILRQLSILTPEAEIAAAAFERARDNLFSFLHACVSGQELVDLGYREDVEIAAQLDVSQVVPRLRDGAFVATPGSP